MGNWKCLLSIMLIQLGPEQGVTEQEWFWGGHGRMSPGAIFLHIHSFPSPLQGRCPYGNPTEPLEGSQMYQPLYCLLNKEPPLSLGDLLNVFFSFNTLLSNPVPWKCSPKPLRLRATMPSMSFCRRGDTILKKWSDLPMSQSSFLLSRYSYCTNSNGLWNL